MESILQVAGLAIVMPAGIAALSAILARFLHADGAGRGVALSLGLGLALFAGFPGASGGIPALPPIDSIGWIPFGTLAATLLLVALEGRSPRPAPLHLALVFALGAGGAFLVGRPTWLSSSAGVAALAIALVGLGAPLASASLDSAARRLPVWSVLASLLMAATGASIASVLSNTALFAMLFGGVAAALGGAMIAGLVFKSLSVPRAGLAIVVLSFAWQLLYVRLYAGLPLASLALAGASLFAPYAAMRLVSERVRARPFVAVAMTALLAGAAVLAAFLASSPTASGGAAGGDYVG